MMRSIMLKYYHRLHVLSQLVKNMPKKHLWVQALAVKKSNSKIPTLSATSSSSSITDGKQILSQQRSSSSSTVKSNRESKPIAPRKMNQPPPPAKSSGLGRKPVPRLGVGQ